MREEWGGKDEEALVNYGCGNPHSPRKAVNTFLCWLCIQKPNK